MRATAGNSGASRMGAVPRRVRRGSWCHYVGLIALLLPRFTLADPGDLVVNWTDVRQTIDGWGASDAFGAPQLMSDAQADLFFSQAAGIGLSFLRVGIRSNGTDYASTANITKASARGARIWAVPWTAPAAWKDNNDTSDGGHLCAATGQGTCTASRYDDWGNQLAAFVTDIKASTGIDIYALSVQNEPDFTATYDSMLYTNQELVNFVKVLGPKLAALPVPPKLMCGEYAFWGNLWGMAAAVEADATALAYIDIYTTHQYGGVSAYQGPRPRPVWQTEMAGLHDPFDPGIAHGVTVAKWIWDAIVNGNVTAWHYWWLDAPFSGFNSGLTNVGTIEKHLYTFGNYSRFVRPGWVRIGASGLTNPNLYATAYKDDTTGDFAIVVVNDSGGDLSFAASFTGANVTSVTPYVTDASRSLEPQTAVTVTAGRFTYPVPYGVTTFVRNVAALVPPDRNTAKCEDTVARKLATLAGCISKCEIKRADSALKGKLFDAAACVQATGNPKSCRSAYDAASAALLAESPSICPVCLDASRQKSLADIVTSALEAFNGRVYCAGSVSLGGYATGFVPPDKQTAKCEETVAKKLMVLASCVRKCQIKHADSALNGTPFDATACIEGTGKPVSCRAAYDAASAKLLAKSPPICPACLDAAAQSDLADLITNVLDNNGPIYCAGTTAVAAP